MQTIFDRYGNDSMSGTVTEVSTTLEFRPSLASDSVEDVIPLHDFRLNNTDVDELLDEVGKAAEELCGHRDSECSDIHEIWAVVRRLCTQNARLLVENDGLRVELKGVRERLEDVCAAVTGDRDARIRVCDRAALEQRRNALVKRLSEGRYSDWMSYVESFPPGLTHHAPGDALHSIATVARPLIEEKAAMPPLLKTDSRWKVLVKRRTKEAREAREALTAEYANKVQESQEAQEALDLLNDKGIWKLCGVEVVGAK